MQFISFIRQVLSFQMNELRLRTRFYIVNHNEAEKNTYEAMFNQYEQIGLKLGQKTQITNATRKRYVDFVQTSG